MFDGIDEGKGGDCWAEVYVVKSIKDEDDGDRRLEVIYNRLRIEAC